MLLRSLRSVRTAPASQLSKLAALAAPVPPVLTASHGPPCPHPEPLSCECGGVRTFEVLSAAYGRPCWRAQALSCEIRGTGIVAVHRSLAKARAGRPQRAWEAPGLRGSGAASAASFVD